MVLGERKKNQNRSWCQVNPLRKLAGYAMTRPALILGRSVINDAFFAVRVFFNYIKIFIRSIIAPRSVPYPSHMETNRLNL